MADAELQVVVKTRGQRDLERLKRQLDATGQEYEELKPLADRAANSIRRTGTVAGQATRKVSAFGSATSKASKGVNQFARAVKGLLAAYTGFETAKFIIGSTAELETQARSLQVLTGSAEEARDIIQELQDFGSVTPFTSTELIDTAKRLKAFGVDTEDLVETTKRLGDVAGATGAELNGIATAYGQIQAKGKLQTEELLQLQERGVDLAGVLKEEYELTGEEFSKALQKGQISAEAAEYALKKLTDTGGKYADGAIAQSDTLAGKFSTLVDNVTRFSQALGQILSPTLKGLLDQVNDLIDGFNRLFESAGVEAGLRNAGALDDGLRLEIWQEATKEAERLLRIGKTTKDEFGKIRLNIFQESLKGLAVNEGLIKPRVAPTTTEVSTLPPLLNSNGNGNGSDKALRDARRAVELGDKAAEQRRIALRDQEQLLQRLEAQIKLESSITDKDRFINQLALDQLEIRQDINNSLEDADGALADLIKREGELRSRLALDQNTRPFFDAGYAMGEGLAELEEFKDESEAIAEIWNGIGGEISNVLFSLVEGTEDLNAVLADTLKSISKLLFSAGLKLLGGNDGVGLFSILGGSFGGARASGGPVSGGSSYLVGERGPELFTPSSSGMITPNSALSGGGNTIVNITVNSNGTTNQSSSGKDAEEAAQLGRLIERSTLAIINREKRPGGTLAR